MLRSLTIESFALVVPVGKGSNGCCLDLLRRGLGVLRLLHLPAWPAPSTAVSLPLPGLVGFAGCISGVLLAQVGDELLTADF